MTHFWKVVIVAGFSLASATSAAAIYATVDVIVSGSTVIPGATGTFRFLSEPAIENGTIAFVGSNDASGPGIYMWQSGGLQVVADERVQAPGGILNFGTFGLPKVGSGAVIFPAELSDGTGSTGVYRFSAGNLTTVLDGTTTLPGLVAPRPVTDIAARGDALFAQNLSDGTAFVHRLTPGNPAAIAISGQAAPGGGTFGTFRRAATDGAQVSFITTLAGSSTSVLLVSDAGGLSVIAAPGTPLPNGQLEAHPVNHIHSHAGGQVAFIGVPVGLPKSIYVWQSGQIRLAVAGTVSPGGSGPFDNFASVAVSEDGDLAFVGYSGLYIQSGDQRQEVLNTRTQIDGQLVTGIHVGPSGISDNVVTAKLFLGNEELIVRIPYTVSPAGGGGGGGGGGGAVDPWSLLMLGAVLRAALLKSRKADSGCRPRS